MTLCKKYPVAYNGEIYYAKIFKYNWEKYINKCTTKIYKRVLFFNIPLHEEKCTYSIGKDNDYEYFIKETIKRYLQRKKHEEINKNSFEKWDGVC